MTEENERTAAGKCLACGRASAEIPLLPVEYRNQRLWICPQHLPILIHDPQRLAGTLAGAEDMQPAEHHD
jgi:hypothetical protein